ncbi:MAG: imidazolonepropionase [Gammaproteobacteria bacterium]|nr:imidazolonepropionase [Gammaproteobacteria bacterium PRO8]MDL1881902.1 imidazolonepropionase [Gammaproteobacteria bacterium PRO2]GIK34496.1 MAG: imidazolonepropionase [Gammaproteobacteria bacterium]
MSDDRRLWHGAGLFTSIAGVAPIADGALVTRGERIEWVGAAAALPASLRNACVVAQDLGGAWITPGLIDCHTHLVFAGTRAREYSARLRGASYEGLAGAGGGILETMRATRAASEAELLAASRPRLAALCAEGVTTVEIKSGYGLDFASEAKMLRVARALGAEFPVTVRTSFLGAHALPPEFAGRADAYIDTLSGDWLPRLAQAGLVDAVDIYCDRIGFSPAQARRLFTAARALGLPVKMHAEQLANLGGSQLAAEFAALSCDHLEHTTAADAAALAAAGTVAVLLPLAWYCLGETRRPPVDALRSAGVELAVASDCNPGSAPGASLLLALAMATRSFGLDQAEALCAATRGAAQALGLGGDRGTLEPGRTADFAIWNIGGPEELGYWTGFNPCRAVIRAGRLVHGELQRGH